MVFTSCKTFSGSFFQGFFVSKMKVFQVSVCLRKESWSDCYTKEWDLNCGYTSNGGKRHRSLHYRIALNYQKFKEGCGVGCSGFCLGFSPHHQLQKHRGVRNRLVLIVRKSLCPVNFVQAEGVGFGNYPFDLRYQTISFMWRINTNTLLSVVAQWAEYTSIYLSVVPESLVKFQLGGIKYAEEEEQCTKKSREAAWNTEKNPE